MESRFKLFPQAASTFAPDVDAVFYALSLLCSFVLILVVAFILIFCIRYRRESKADRSNPVRNHVPLEVAWLFLPFLLFLALFTWAAQIYFDMRTPPADSLEIHVVGKQWMWKFQYPTGQREINVLHLPIRTPIRLTLTSEDVIHSFFVPEFRIKQDVLPSRYVNAWFQVTRPGRYRLMCAEYCGTFHSKMMGWVVALEKDEYAEWLQTARIDVNIRPRAIGRRMFDKMGCTSCHGPGGSGTATGPSLLGLYGRTVVLEGGKRLIADEEYIRESIVLPNRKVVQGFRPIMPTFQGLMTEEELMGLVSYIQSLEHAKEVKR